jgi:transcription elongation factor Elf1
LSVRRQIDRLRSGDFYQYFRFCPLCYDEDSVEAQFSTGGLLGGGNYADCTSCGAKWEVSIGTYDRRVTAVKLLFDGVDRRGGHLLTGAAYTPMDWQQLALKGRRAMAPKSTNAPVMVKEVVREVVLISCKHCGSRSPQGTPKCTSCGASL